MLLCCYFDYKEVQNVGAKYCYDQKKNGKCSAGKSSPFYGKRFEVVDCDSTSSAAKMVAQNKIDFCLTNAHAVEQYGLKFVSWTTGIDMTWSLFGRAELIPLMSMLRAA